MHKKEVVNIFILYDSITNSVFESQVLTPLIKTGQSWHIISFEKHPVTPPKHPNIIFIFFKKKSYWCAWSLRSAIKDVRTYLAQCNTYQIISRGPFAGYITLQAATSHCKNIIIQARGLAAQEYAYIRCKRFNPLHRVRTQLFHNLEKNVYSTHDPRVTIEVVSPALKKYLINTFHADDQRVTVAQQDIPAIMHSSERLLYRAIIRKKLGINEDQLVYCYSGSYKPWQCPQETLLFFKTQHTKNPNCFLLILTPDVQAFEHHAQQMLPLGSYHICNVPQKRLFHYLAAADVGILLREPHIINYVSRPTKAVEYHAAGLCIVHNNTVEYIKHINGVKQQIVSC